tara:strand:- start:87 stop:1163 length:1077 start_codon:yes stop_codon:yes gene_type:complete
MAIKGLTEKRVIPRLGKIHLGIKVPTADKKSTRPKAVDYFVCPDEVKAVFGDEPRELRILIPMEDMETWASQFYRAYSFSRGLICKGDGEVARRSIDVATGDLPGKDTKETVLKEITCDGRDCPDYGKRCKEVMCLQFLIPEVPGLGIWQIDTSSINSIKNINSEASLIKLLYGRVSMIPLLLTVEMTEVKSPDGKKKKVPLLHLRSDKRLVDVNILKTVDQYLLPVADDETPEMITPESFPDEGVGTDPDPENLFGDGKPKPQPQTEEKTEEKPKKGSTESKSEGDSGEDKGTGSPKTETESSEWLPKNPGDLLNWVQKHGREHTKSWVLENCSITEDQLMADPVTAYRLIKAFTGW